ncbi:MAG: stage II sporulation protein R, partial [Clostridium sp.]
VMFPPICFVDITKGEVAYEETEREMKSVLNEDEFNMVDNTSKENNKKTNKEDNKGVKIVDSTKDNNVVVKFKVAEIFKGLMK